MPLGASRAGLMSVVGDDIPESEIDHDYRWIANDIDLSDGDSVSNWSDITGPADLSAVGSPTFRENSVNEQSSVEIDSVDDGFDIDPFSGTNSLEPDGGLTFIWVFVKFNSADDDGTLAVHVGDNVDLQIRFRGGSLETRIGGGNDPSTPNVTVGDAHIAVGRWDGSEFEMRLDGEIGDQTSDSTLSSNDGQDSVGYRAIADDRRLDGQIMEGIISEKDVTDSNLQTEEQRLADYYGISLA